MKKPHVLVIYDYFDPAVLAGGPIVSCSNLVKFLADRIDFFIFTSSFDLDGSELNVEKDSWVNYLHIAKIFYGKKYWNVKGYIKALFEVKPDVIYINGIYSIVAVLIPLILSRFFCKRSKIIISSRGMLQKNALSVKRTKKNLYLYLFKLLLPLDKFFWHVTSEQEKIELMSFLPRKSSANIILLGNVPSINIRYSQRVKNKKTLKLLTIALISPMKNILAVIKSLAALDQNVIYTLYGTIKDETYWKQCQHEISNLPSGISVRYEGVADRADISEILIQNDFYIQPSKSENFSHSIYDALMSGMPVITSYNTPWKVQDVGAGWNVEPRNIADITSALSEAFSLTQLDFDIMSKKSRQLAEEYLQNENLKDGYTSLFYSNKLTG